MMEKILALRDRTVFTVADFILLFPDRSHYSLRVQISRLAKQGRLLRLASGIYGLPNYNPWELGNKLRTPSYITGHTILFQAGVVFQVASGIFLAANRTQALTASDHRFVYRKLTDRILLRPEGLVTQNGVVIATPERALLDYWYWGGIQGIDNPRIINHHLIRQFNQDIYQQHNITNALRQREET
jgi:predicted transcriptional regulator of viral defense system